MKPFDIGLDAAVIARSGGRGRVRAVFSRAVYLDFPLGLFAITTGTAPRGPLHLRVPRIPAVLPGDDVRADGDILEMAGDQLALNAPVWLPRQPPLTSLSVARVNAQRWCPGLASLVDLRRAGLRSGRRSTGTLRRGDVPGFGAAVVGRGPGLTPAGDDIFAGVLLVAHGMGYELSAQSDTSHQRDVVPAGSTNDIARAFLRSAARGRCIEPAHEFLAALARADHAAMIRSVAQLRRFGASSGIALAYGICLALLTLPSPRPTRDSHRPTRMVDEMIG